MTDTSNSENNVDEEPNKKSSSKKKYITALVALATPAAYLTGLGYYQGVLAAYGISSEAFPLATTDIYIHTYFAIGYFLLTAGENSNALINWTISKPGAFWTIGLIALSIITTYISLKLKDKKRKSNQARPEIINKISQYLNPKNNKLTKACALIFISSYIIYFIPAAIATSAAAWWILPAIAYQKGYDLEIEKVNTFKKFGCTKEKRSTWDKCFTVQNEKGEVIHEGLLVALSSKEIAIFEKNGSYIFTRKDEYTIKRKFH